MQSSPKITIEICVGTTCHIMGGTNLPSLPQHLSDDQLPLVEVTGVPCLGACKDGNYGAAPFVRIDGRIIEQATIDSVLTELERIIATRGNT